MGGRRPGPQDRWRGRWRWADLRDRSAAKFHVRRPERSVGKRLKKLTFSMSVRPLHPQSDLAAQEAFKNTSPGWPAPRSRGRRPAGRNLVSGGSPRWPARPADPHRGQARHASADHARPAVHLGLPVRRHRPGARHRRRVGQADRPPRGQEPLAEMSPCVSGAPSLCRSSPVPAGTVRRVSSCQTTSCSCPFHPPRRSGTRGRTSGSICALAQPRRLGHL